jgi:hypothetical protein
VDECADYLLDYSPCLNYDKALAILGKSAGRAMLVKNILGSEINTLPASFL